MQLESWLNDSVEDTEVHIPGFACVRKDREDHWQDKSIRCPMGTYLKQEDVQVNHRVTKVTFHI